jgi:hypothetical protein
LALVVFTATALAVAPQKKKTAKRRYTKSAHVASTVRRPTTARKAVAAASTSKGKSVRRTATPRTRTYAQQQPSADRYKEIQQALADRGYYKGEVNGAWSAESTAALARFQQSQNLQSDGKLNSLSLIALGLGPKRALSAQAQPHAPSSPAQATQQP